jgi:hypothetical protein
MLHAKLAKPEGMSNKEFYGVWEKEAEAAVAALKAGMISVSAAGGAWPVTDIPRVASR